MMRCVGVFIFPSRSKVAANAFDGTIRNASGANAAAISWRLFMMLPPA
jgi:hypothetical protein